ncbi:PREDICTED: uncharacterized protein LOC109233584 [Nicotiana attenuata]|uniref:uncharacterized protein LOC109233584 n=1 Tax=Nicotiana attenuata TaxID=49451 RepID=UPI000904FEC8|nr:PREDICTED: uncharacterized protein LOC109233584 [Nicotiana attenuata]
MVPVPSVNKVYSILMEHESQKTMASASASLDAGEMAAIMTNRVGNQQKPKKNYNLYCDYHKLKGHTRDICYKLVGYPNDHKFKKKYNPQGTANMATEHPAPATFTSTPTAPTFIPEQYQQILQLLNSEPTEVTANAAELETSTITCLMTCLNQGVWIIDSGASNHMTPRLDLLHNVVSLNKSRSVHLPNGELADIAHNGSTNIFKDHKISDDLYAGKVLGIGSESNGLYILKDCTQKIQLNTPIAHTTAMQTTTQKKSEFNKAGNLASEAWTSTCGDLWGPYRVPTRDNKRFFLTVVDDFSRSTWLFLMNVKDEAYWLMKRLICMIHTQFNCHVKTIRTDNGLEFVNSDMRQFLKSQRIIHLTTSVYNPQQNGVLERRHRYILEVARALRFQAAIPLRFWGDCVLTAMHIINRIPSTVLKGKSPYEMLFNTPPSLEHLKVFKCLCYAVNVRRQDKFSARALPAIFMGYSPTKRYKLYDLYSKQFLVSRDVIFKEQIFPFKHMKVSSIPIFPVLELANPVDVPPINDASQPVYDEFPNIGEMQNANEMPEEADTSLDDQEVDISLDVPPPSVGEATDDLPQHQGTTDILPISIRKHHRFTGPPKWMQDFVSTSCAYPMTNYLNYDNLSSSYAKCLIAQSSVVEPKHYAEAARGARW